MAGVGPGITVTESPASDSGGGRKDEASRDSSRSLTPSPRLSRKMLEEIMAENTCSTEDPENYPLHSTWSFWFDRSQRGGNAGDFFANLRCLSTVSSIKAFWRVFNNLPTCDKLKDRDSYHLMRDEKRRPVWEDVDNVHGGMWVMKVDKHYTVRTWQELLLAAIGEQFSECVHPDDEICGVSVRIRFDSDVIQIWNKDAHLHAHATVVNKVKELIPTLEIRHVYYSSNEEKMRDSLSKPVHTTRGHSPPPPAMMGHRYPGPHPHNLPARPPFGPPHHPLPMLRGPPRFKPPLGGPVAHHHPPPPQS